MSTEVANHSEENTETVLSEQELSPAEGIAVASLFLLRLELDSLSRRVDKAIGEVLSCLIPEDKEGEA